jgi:hypothetical protein
MIPLRRRAAVLETNASLAATIESNTGVPPAA